MSTNKICIIKNCNTIASFNYRGVNNRRFCSKHKTPDMVNVRYKLCGYKNCKNRQKKGNMCLKHYISIEDIATILLSLHTKKIEI